MWAVESAPMLGALSVGAAGNFMATSAERFGNAKHGKHASRHFMARHLRERFCLLKRASAGKRLLFRYLNKIYVWELEQ